MLDEETIVNETEQEEQEPINTEEPTITDVEPKDDDDNPVVEDNTDEESEDDEEKKKMMAGYVALRYMGVIPPSL